MARKPNIIKEQEKMAEELKDQESMSGSLMDDFANAGSMSDDDSPVDMDFSDVYDEIVHPTGKEAKLRCIAADKGVDKNEADYWRLRYEDVEDPHVKQISVFIGFPKKGVHDVRQVNNKKKAFMEWKAAHNVPLNQPVALKDCIGLEAWAILRQTESEEYGLQNDVKKWITPKGGVQGF